MGSCVRTYILERFRNIEYCRANDIDVEPKILENSNIGVCVIERAAERLSFLL